MLKWYLRIYIFIKYLKCVWKSNCIWIIQNDSKKKKKKSEDCVPGSDRVGYSVGRHTLDLIPPKVYFTTLGMEMEQQQ